jgi:hypothetical protein
MSIQRLAVDPLRDKARTVPKKWQSSGYGVIPERIERVADNRKRAVLAVCLRLGKHAVIVGANLDG